MGHLAKDIIRQDQPIYQKKRREPSAPIVATNKQVSNEQPGTQGVRTRSGRVSKPAIKYQDEFNMNHIVWNEEIICYGSADPDTMYNHQVIKEGDQEQFKMAMQHEIDSHQDNKHWKLVKRDKVPQGILIVPSVWAMKQKRHISTREVYKWKSRLNYNGSKKIKGIHYTHSFAPVNRWFTIRLLLIHILINGLYRR